MRTTRAVPVAALLLAVSSCAALVSTKEDALALAERLQTRICELKAHPGAAATLAELRKELEARGWVVEVPCA